MVKDLIAHGHEPVPLKANLLDLDAIVAEISGQNLAAVIHLAAISTVTHANANGYYEVNLIGSRNLMLALVDQSDLSAVLLASSGQVYGRGDYLAEPLTRARGFRESDRVSPANEYGVSKFAMEQMAQLWLDRLPLIAARPFNYTGIGQSSDFIIPKIVDHFKNRADVMPIGNTNLWREFGDVRNVVSAYRQIIENSDVINRDRLNVVNVCTQAPTRLCDVIEMCSAYTGHTMSLEVNPEFIREGEPEILIGDASYLNKLLPNHIPRDLAQTLDWMLSN